ncbi:hypothetical protein [Tepidibacillus sp. HK-1]|uniref:hypothetical protein n=1 Tax=Tepidibacillus sp. HK-1 TaxID=1883407 RepID=UPI0008539B8F|nr:hypothetical protein [Tepidibacillus sp. HK-1]GBF12452.1 hypothetical protein HK1_02518 [Tepidibacillus sp. HK-1]
MDETINTYLGLPQYMWEGIFNIIVTLGAGLIIAFVTTFYLKKKDEITRVSGIILEKCVNSEQEILDYLERLSYHLELHNGKEKEWYALLTSFDLTLPHGSHLQYSDVFSSVDKFQEFFKGFEEVISRNKLWMGKKVRFHLALMQAYFSWINALLLGITRVPLPEGKELSREDIDKLSGVLLLQVGITLDHEINGLLAELETLIVDSVYKLDLKRPKKSMTRNGMLNSDMLKILKELDTRTLLGINREKYFALMMTQVYHYKGMDPEEDDLDEIINEVFGEESAL